MSLHSRRRSVCASYGAAGAAGILVTRAPNVRYLSGFTGTNGWFLLLDGQASLLTDPRYAQQAAEQVVNAAIVISSAAGLQGPLREALAGRDIARLGFEVDGVTVALKKKLDAAFDGEWVPLEGIVERPRRAKDAAEIEAVKAAMALAEAALEAVAARLRPGMSEREIAGELEHACRVGGGEGMAFETIVASGPRSALPHGVASERLIAVDEPVMIDMGCRLAGYCSDITRMLWCGNSPSSRWLEMHALVNEARAAAMATVAAGVRAADVDQAARSVIGGAGFGEAFSHGTGHGVGLEIHEAPKLAERSDDILEAGMLVTIEPAVYFEGEFGIRIEDLVRVTNDGWECLTTLDTKPILRGIS